MKFFLLQERVQPKQAVQLEKTDTKEVVKISSLLDSMLEFPHSFWLENHRKSVPV